nr:hypothetical protein [Tanacetum cinerariifolium]
FDQRKDDGKLRHVADSPQWRKINNKFSEFAKEIRNIRFGLCSDGINPFGNMSSRYRYSTKGKQACPICEDETSSRWLDNCKKTVFMGHRRSLPSNHPYRGHDLVEILHFLKFLTLTLYLEKEKGVKLNKERGKKANFLGVGILEGFGSTTLY